MMIRGVETESNFLTYLEEPGSGVWYPCQCSRQQTPESRLIPQR